MTEKRDYFNLESSEDEEEDNKLKEDVVVSKWDWDRAENIDLYYQNRACSSILKRESADDYNIEPVRKRDKPEESRGYSAQSHNMFDLVGHTGSVNRIHWSKKSNPDLLLSSSMDNKIIIWNVQTRRQVRCLSEIHSRSVRNAIWSNSEAEIVSVSYDQTCALVDVENGKEMARLRHDKHLTAVCNHPKQDNMILIGSKNEILAWDCRTSSKKATKVYKSSMNQVQDLVFLDNESFVSSGDIVSKDSSDHSLIVWDYESTARLSSQLFHERYVCTSLAKHPHRSLFYAQTHGNYICQFDSRPPYKMNKTQRFESGHVSQGYSIGIDLNRSGNLMASGSSDSSIYIYNTHTTKLVKKLDIPRPSVRREPCMDVKFKLSHGKETLAASFYDGVITILDI